MEVILLQKIANLGNIGDRVKVKPGFGRNYLLPGGKATLATAENVAKFEARRAELEDQAAKELTSAQQRAAALEGFKLTITAKAGSEGKLFGSIGNGLTVLPPHLERPETWPELVGESREERRTPEGSSAHWLAPGGS